MNDRSGTITVGGTAQELAPLAQSGRAILFVQNHSEDDLWFCFGATAVASQPCYRVPSGETLFLPPALMEQTAISIIGATAGQAFTVKEA